MISSKIALDYGYLERKDPGGDSYMEQTGMLVGNFEFNP